jgi:nicotinate-nucleotide adenylyltransferase
MPNMKLGVLGGAFNPVHVGHLLAAREAREALGLDKVLLVPCARPALKSIRLWPGKRRLGLLKLALRGQEGLEADGLELARGGTSYTVDTLRQLGRRPGVAKLTFLMGSDAFRGLPSWREPDALRALADLVVMRRPGSGAWLDGPEGRRLLKRHRARVLDIPAWDVSSSEVRRRLKRGLPLRWLVPEAVEKALLS